MSITNAQKARKRGLKKVFNSLTLQTYQTYIQEAFKVFEWLSMTFLASFLKTETLVMENYCPHLNLKMPNFDIMNCVIAMFVDCNFYK